jgi:hypothetical protein
MIAISVEQGCIDRKVYRSSQILSRSDVERDYTVAREAFSIPRSSALGLGKVDCESFGGNVLS